MDGSNRLTTRNRRYVKPIVPVSSPKITVSDPSNLVDVGKNDCNSSTGPDAVPVVESASDESDVVPLMVSGDTDVGSVPLVSPAVGEGCPVSLKQENGLEGNQMPKQIRKPNSRYGSDVSSRILD